MIHAGLFVFWSRPPSAPVPGAPDVLRLILRMPGIRPVSAVVRTRYLDDRRQEDEQSAFLPESDGER